MSQTSEELDDFMSSVEALRQGRIGGVEVASRPLPSVSQLLMAGLVHDEGERLGLEVARWIADEAGVGTAVPGSATLRLEDAAGIKAALALLDAATLPLTKLTAAATEDEAVILARDHDFAVSVGRPVEPPGEPRWLLLSEISSGRGCAVPALELPQLKQVLEESLATLERAGMFAHVGGGAAVH